MRVRVLFPALLLLPLGTLNAQQDRAEFNWSRSLSAGKSIEIIGVNGSIRAGGKSGGSVEVHAIKRGHRSDPETVTFEVVEHDNGVTICAMYPSSDQDRPNQCRAGGGRMNTRRNDVEVEWTVTVPAGVRFTGRTVNGRVEARGLSAPVMGYTVNGAVDLETSSWADASSVNGSLTVRMGRADWDGEKEFSTVNGGITVYLPSAASFEVSASSVNGSLSTDFPLTIRGRWGPRRMSGTVGQGGRTLSLSTVNGALELRKGS